MNKQEMQKAINHLTMLRRLDSGEKKGLYDLAISALTQQLNNGWIPVSSGRLPEDTDGDDLATVYVCMKFKDSPFGNDDAVYQDVVDFMTDEKIWLIEDGFKVTAWRPRFEPYKEVSE